MSVWDFGRKTRDEMNERTSSAILRRSKPRNGALREGRGAYSYLRQIDDLIFNDAGTAIRNNFHRNNHHDHVLYRVVVVGRHFLAPSLSPLFFYLPKCIFFTENHDPEILYRCKTRSTLPNAFRRKLRSWRYCLTGYSLPCNIRPLCIILHKIVRCGRELILWRLLNLIKN